MAFLFCFSLLVILYTFVGYPLVIWFLAYIKPKNISRSEYAPDITIVFSVFNEEANISKKIENCLSLDYSIDKISIIVVSDGSTDNTCNILKEFCERNKNLIYIDNAEQRGKAACINDAFSLVKTEYVVLTDVRQEFNKIALSTLMSNFYDTNVGAVGGELQFKDEGVNDFSKGVDVYWYYEKFIRKYESLLNSSVGVSGAIYAIRTKLFQPIPENTILDDVLIPMNIVKQQFRVVFDGDAIAYDIPSSDELREKKRKTRTIAGNYQLLQLAPFLINPFRNSLFVQYFSHKILRLVMPLFLLFLLVSNMLLFQDNVFYKVSMVGQVLFYIMPMANKLISLPRALAKISNAINAFLSLNYFSILGFLEFLNSKNTHIWK